MDRDRFCCEPGRNLAGYHIARPGDTSARCGLDDVEILKQEVTESSLAEHEWQTCPACLERYQQHV